MGRSILERGGVVSGQRRERCSDNVTEKVEKVYGNLEFGVAREEPQSSGQRAVNCGQG
jgi:hypothetical protein